MSLFYSICHTHTNTITFKCFLSFSFCGSSFYQFGYCSTLLYHLWFFNTFPIPFFRFCLSFFVFLTKSVAIVVDCLLCDKCWQQLKLKTISFYAAATSADVQYMHTLKHTYDTRIFRKTVTCACGIRIIRALSHGSKCKVIYAPCELFKDVSVILFYSFVAICLYDLLWIHLFRMLFLEVSTYVYLINLFVAYRSSFWRHIDEHKQQRTMCTVILPTADLSTCQSHWKINIIKLIQRNLDQYNQILPKLPKT